MNWEKVYAEKLVSAEEAVTHIKSENRVVAGHAAGTPERLLQAMVENKDAYRNVEIVHQVAMGKSLYCLPEYKPHFTHNSLFCRRHIPAGNRRRTGRIYLRPQ